MKKTTFLPALGLILAATALLTAFSVKSALIPDEEFTFEEFLQQFPAQRLPYVLDENSLKARLNKYVSRVNHPSNEPYSVTDRPWNHESYKYMPKRGIDELISRSPVHTEPEAMFATADNFAVLYSTSMSYSYGYPGYHLVVYDKTGNIISTNVVGSVSAGTILSSVISKTLQAEIKTWQINWEKDYDKSGLDGNKITGLSYVESRSIDLLKPTPKNPNPFEGTPIAPPVIEENTKSEGLKSM